VNAADRKFEEESLPIILAAIQRARLAGMYSEIVIKVVENGGVLEIKTITTQKIK